LYEQALGNGAGGLPESEAASLGIHESQSRFWENHIGRNQFFWKGALPQLRKKFPLLFPASDAEALYQAMNRLEPCLLRTQADELSYHLHIQIRYEIEKELIGGNMLTKDIPNEWNRLYATHLGLKVPSDVQGFMQDIHWAHGSFGYFPTYSLGSLYAAQFYNSALKNIPMLEQSIEELQFKKLHAWMKEGVYRFGRTKRSEEICLLATGEPLNPKYFIRYASEKFNQQKLL
jgi:carboxypeptidase Taq